MALAQMERNIESDKEKVSFRYDQVTWECLRLEYGRVMHESMLMSVLMYGSEKERPTIRVVWKDALGFC